MTNEEKIVKALENLQAGQERMEKTQQEQGAAIQQQGTAIGRIITVLKVLEAGQNDIRENMATKADVQESKAEQAKLKRRVENLEEHTKTPNPQKN